MTLAVILLGLGLACVLAEVFVPSLGLLSIAATAAIVGAVIAAFQQSTGAGINFLLVVALSVPATMLVAFKLLPRSPWGRRMVSSGLSFESSKATDARDLALVGQEGLVLSDLRPAGHARIGERRVDVVSRGESIPAGARVRVLEVAGNRVVVVRADVPGPSSSPS
jgi:membrane-bound serine protease (ClpP class)